MCLPDVSARCVCPMCLPDVSARCVCPISPRSPNIESRSTGISPRSPDVVFGAGLFGQTHRSAPTSVPNLFGQTHRSARTTSVPNLFGQTHGFAPTSVPNLFGQTHGSAPTGAHKFKPSKFLNCMLPAVPSQHFYIYHLICHFPISRGYQ